ncbi:MAG TPA: YdjY domain-containing protein, partial [Victivallales bacterium]|nr:YdjY domain-containing protein [Victivallales bacterium]
MEKFCKNSINFFIFAVFASTILFSGCKSIHSEENTNINEKKEAELPPLSEQEINLLKKLGGEVLEDGNIKIGLAKIDRKKMEISFPAEVNLKAGEIEVLICIPGGRAHESLLITNLEPLDLQIALLLIGAENGLRTPGGHIQQGTLLKIEVEPEGGKRIPVEKWIREIKTGKERQLSDWVFVGSNFTHDGTCLAKEEGNIANTWTFGNTIIDNPSDDATDDSVLEIFSERVPRVGTKVTVYIRKK